MTLRDYIEKKGWETECQIKLRDHFAIVHIDFVNDTGTDDETSLDVPFLSVSYLDELFESFCKENHFPLDTVNGVTVVATAPTMEALQRINL